MVVSKPIVYRTIILDDEKEACEICKKCPGYNNNPHEVMEDNFVKKREQMVLEHILNYVAILFSKTKTDKDGYVNPRRRIHQHIEGIEHVFCVKRSAM